MGSGPAWKIDGPVHRVVAQGAGREQPTAAQTERVDNEYHTEECAQIMENRSR